ncbi:MAG: LptF/LptG family permease [Proteobacteria bacterium]|jgi:lipopolysaccharide export system permease protein|nr:LptF/LptG family permease [Alphaproteobacteria bacterium]NCC03577.1 LptF/LptG family permease [Pseudomonadota bacterium]
MIKGWTLSAYLGKQYFFWFLVFFFGLTGIIYLFEVAELMRRSADLTATTFPVVLRMGAYKLPDTIEKILPFVVLFSGMFSFWRLTRSQELIVARAAGISAWQFLAPALLVTLLFGGFNIMFINPIGTNMITRYEEMEAKYLKNAPALELTGAGLWLRQEKGNERYLLHADQVDLNPLTLHPLILFIYDREGEYRGRIDAPAATLQGHTWVITNAWYNAKGELPVFKERFELETSVTLEKIQESMAAPNTISLWKLPSFIRVLKSIGLPATRHELQLQTLLAEPILLCAMIFFAAAFSLRLNRRGGILNAMMSGILVGSLVFSCNNVVMALGSNQTLPVFLAAWAIPLAALITGQATLLYLEDG